MLVDKVARKLGILKGGSFSGQAMYASNFYTGGISAAEDMSSWLQQYGASSWVFISVNRRAAKISSLEMELVSRDKEGLKQVVHDHIFLDILEKPNDMMTGTQLRFLLSCHLNLAGEAFWYINENIVGGVAAIYPLNPAYVKIIPGEGDQLVAGYLYEPPGQRVAYTEEEVAHFFYPNPDPENFFRGASPLDAIKYAVGSYNNSEIWNFQFFKNGARPGGLLYTDLPLDRAESNRLRKLWEQQHRGQNNWQKVAVASHGLKYQEVGLSHKDMDFVNQLVNAREVILAAYGVPKSVVGLVQDVNKANAFQDELNFATYTIGPEASIVAGTINNSVLNRFSKTLRIEFKNLIPRDQEMEIERHRTYLQYGVLTINEVRTEMNLPPVDWGDEPILMNNYLPLSVNEAASQPAPIEDLEAAEGTVDGEGNVDSEEQPSDNGNNNITEETLARFYKEIQKVRS